MTLPSTLKLFILTIFLQFAVVSNIFYAPWIPNILTLLVLFLGFYEASLTSLITVFCCGLLFDMAASSVLGPSSAAAIIIFVIVSILSKRVFIDAPLSGVIFGFISGFFFALIRGTLLSPFIAQEIFMISAKEGLVTAILSPIVLTIFRKILPKKISTHGSYR